MELLGTIWSYAVPFIVVITVIVFFHELGHYLFARLNGVRVEVFSIGFGREIFGFFIFLAAAALAAESILGRRI